MHADQRLGHNINRHIHMNECSKVQIKKWYIVMKNMIVAINPVHYGKPVLRKFSLHFQYSSSSQCTHRVLLHLLLLWKRLMQPICYTILQTFNRTVHHRRLFVILCKLFQM